MSDQKKLNQQHFRKNAQHKIRIYSKSDPKDYNLGGTKYNYCTTDIESNWNHYNETENEETDSDSSFGTDYNFGSPSGTSSEAPVTHGVYIELKKDKQFISDTKFESCGLFQMDLDQVCLGIMSIPFYERFGIEKDLLDNNLIGLMDASAEESLMIYKDYLSEKLKPKRVQLLEPLVTVDSGMINIEEVIKEPDRKVAVKNKEVDEWLEDILD